MRLAPADESGRRGQHPVIASFILMYDLDKVCISDEEGASGMLLKVDRGTKAAERVSGVPLSTFDMNERDLQAILFGSLDRLIGDDELLVLMQSRQGKEEPDLMALDGEGNLYIFEIKVWESHRENLLQVLRYGQLFGAHDYDGLDRIWRQTGNDDRSLALAHDAKFDRMLRPEEFNRRQIFVVLTNGLDVDTRQAIRYWRSTGLDVRPWIYRAYQVEGEMFLEISPFRTADDPLEDQSESLGEGFYIVNTNVRDDEENDRAMLAERKVAAYFKPWKFKIARLKRGDHVFLYRSGVGIVAAGKADGKLRKSAYQGDPEHAEEEYCMGLLDFVLVDPPLPAADVKIVTERPDLVFRQTMFSLDRESGAKLDKAVRERQRS